jgi:small nuclear ribonucleoprotein D2
VLVNVRELWTDPGKKGKGQKKATPVNRSRFISKMFLRGDSVICVTPNPLGGPQEEKEEAAQE